MAKKKVRNSRRAPNKHEVLQSRIFLRRSAKAPLRRIARILNPRFPGFISMADRFQQVRLACRDAAKSIAGANFGNGALVAVDTSIVAHLEKQRTVAEAITAFNAFGAPNAQPLVDGVFVVRIFHERALDGGSGTETILRAGIEIVWFGLKIARAELAIAAHREGVHAFHRGLFQHAMGRAVATMKTLLRVNLPHCCLGGTVRSNQPEQPS